jgi:hypothetical protein
MERRCANCKIIKPLEDFKTDKRKMFGKGYICRPCDRERARGLYYKYHNKRLVVQRRYYQENKGKWGEKMLLSMGKYPEKFKARTIFRNAILRGEIKKLPCEVCGSNKAQGHHPDYSKPLEVIWLCQAHHSAIHRKYPAIKYKPVIRFTHPTQLAILGLSQTEDVWKMSLRGIGKRIGVTHPNLVKVHLNQLVKKGLLVKSSNYP